MQEPNKPRRKRRKTLQIGSHVIEHWQMIAVVLAVYDFIAVCLGYFLALYLRYDATYTSISQPFIRAYARFIFPWALNSIVIFLFFKMYNSMWRFASFTELIRTFMGSMVSSVLHAVLITVIFTRMPISYYIWGAFFQFILLCIPRFAFRLVNLLRYNREPLKEGGKRVMIIGAGDAGQTILREIMTARELTDKVVCIIDDNPNKWNRYLEGVPIVGGRDEILTAAEKYNVDEIILAIPTASVQTKRDILAVCSETDCKLKQLPGIYQLVNGEVSVSSIREVAVEDLLGRDPIRTDMQEVFEFITGKTVLVTGGGGSIGSELCRQIAAHQPKQLIIFDIYENGAYDIQQELIRKYHNKLNLVTLIGSVRNTHRIESVMMKYKPNIVFHAAAHKHVPLMEDSPNEAIKNNVMGTYKTAVAAAKAGVETFVLISTDKAVNPTNLMGASKRICEMVIQMMNRQETNTKFVAVRFGNVLGSNGSVIPLFRKQIEEGGPVTVTHKDIIRYFMTIPEAVSLVLQASQYAKGGEIFVLDMGDPVKIDDMARNLIKLSGLTPDVDIKIVYTGLRPGEKLYEEKLMDEEGMQTTDNKLIFIGQPIEMDDEKLRKKIEELDLDSQEDDENIKKYVQEIVPTYKPGSV